MSSPTMASKRRAPYTSIACNTCRRRRCKCDGARPTCGTCSFYVRPCNWNQEDISQRPATKQLVQSLRMRIRELESEINQLRVGPIGGGGEGHNQENDSTMLPASPATNIDENDRFPRRSHLTVREGDISATGPTSMWSTFLDEPTPLRENKASHPESIYRYIFQQISSIPLHMQSQDIQMSDQCEWDRHLPKFNASIGFTRLEHDILLHICFNYHTLWLRMLEPDLFLRDMLLELTSDPDHADATKSSQRLTYYSPFLHCALMSLATAFSKNPEVRSKHVREQFARRAKELLESECERPTLAAVHGLAFLSEHHGSLGERGLAYLYSVGLCISGRAMMESGMITQEELTSRTWLFWALFCQDKLTSLEYGRDYAISLPHLDVELPEVDPVSDQYPWQETYPSGTQDHTSQPNQVTLVFFQGCRLMLIAVRIMETLYLQGRQQFGVMENDCMINTHMLLENWYKNLPTQLQVQSQAGRPPPPHIIVLHVAYWWLLILLHRPFTFRTQPPDVSEQPASTAFTNLSTDVCERAAKNIVQLVAIFDQTYGCRFFPLSMLQAIFTAGATLLTRYTASDSASEQHTDAYTMAQGCIRALRVAAQTWELARLYASRLEVLLSEKTSQSSFDSYYPRGDIYQPLAPEHDDTVSRMFRDFIVHYDQEAEELGIPLATMQYQYPLLQQLNQPPERGMPPGSELVPDAGTRLPSFSPFPNEGDSMGQVEHFPSGTGA
ncbi:unnamed protein product [Rhizoctonia solani]|uniref:Zn(2)-C6 fungal-type domain-containing protein n=1 Tax=Rhizoctonia solani TaxID=456999 RepID=A0A8H3AK00_9AGAM|nr:unnamed protein product [Rhizoctonia solani]